MTVNVAHWSETFPQDQVPPFRCPACNQGSLAQIKGSLKVVESQRSKRARSHEDWEPDWVDQRFVLLLECSSSSCGELVVVSGDTVFGEEDDEELGRIWASQLRPRSMFPAPYIIELPKEVPDSVRRELEQSFQLFWADLNASANRLRTSLERGLDEVGIKKFNRTGKRVSISLAQRIGIFEKQNGADLSEIFTALRHVGNLGTHASVSRTALLTAFTLYEHALAEWFGSYNRKIAAMSKKLVKSKGKMR
ncbi:DUF4145 domain-containing protein [Bradyrhizobium sp. HKCCYLS20291]|uniref:DUF4145 domain-containing protein n=1 Tax=Bradyrhizobium sp. HKCCYLS20291 TaxID=3420766 RepID=UPI003EB77AD7